MGVDPSAVYAERVRRMHTNGLSVPEIATHTRLSQERVRRLIGGIPEPKAQSDAVLAITAEGPRLLPSPELEARVQPPRRERDEDGGGLDELLADARKAGGKRLVRLADRAESAVSELRAAVEAWQESASVVAEVERARKALAEAQARLRAARGGGTVRPAQTQRGAVREWARANGYDVRDRGKLPGAVVEAYEREHES